MRFHGKKMDAFTRLSLITLLMLVASLLMPVTTMAQAVIDVRVAQSTDDAEERISDGDMELTSSDLEIIELVGLKSQIVE